MQERTALGCTLTVARARYEGPLYTPESCHEAVILRAYCESRWPIGPESHRRLSVTGEEHVALSPYPPQSGFDSPESARLAAQAHFDRYAAGKFGTLYWRVVPEIALSAGRQIYVYYLRLLISNKPQIQKAT